MPLLLRPLDENADLAGTFQIPEGATSSSVGRLRDNDLTILHDSVSGLHARIESSGDNGIELVDCGSSNGTFVNGIKIERSVLNPGDLVRFASAKFRVEAKEVGGEEEREIERARHESEVELLRAQSSREAQAAEERIARLSAELSSVRQESLEKDKLVATLQFEISRHETALKQADEKLREAVSESEQWQALHREADAGLQQHKSALADENERAEALQGRLNAVLSAIDELAETWRQDWSFWTEFEEPGEASRGDDLAGLHQLESLREGIRSQLDLIEPIWKEHGERVASELRSRCEALKEEQHRIAEEKAERQNELTATEAELARLREEVDREVRRAQGLSRRNVEVEIPERYEAMVIARDREQALFLAIIEQVEFFERLIDGYRRSKKMKEAIYELEDFKKRLIAILEENGVEAFELEPGVVLTLKQRREVKVFGRKGWGTREYIEQPFQPGKVVKVIRCGYRAGTGDSAVVLRKVEVLIQEAEG